MNYEIIGAGMAGLLAARMLIASGNKVKVFETQSSLPENHSAVLRFRSPNIGDILGITFKKVQVIRETIRAGTFIRSSIEYSEKTLGGYRTGRSLPIVPEIVDRWIAPKDFVNQIYDGLPEGTVEFGVTAELRGSNQTPKISTIPLPVLLKKFPGATGTIEFRSTGIFNISSTITDCDCYCSLYVPQTRYQFYRISITGNHLIIECQDDKKGVVPPYYQYFDEACELLGIDIGRCSKPVISFQKNGKMQPINEIFRRESIHYASSEFNIWSLGRYATWRPKLLLDDLVNDIRQIEKWTKADRYQLWLEK